MHGSYEIRSKQRYYSRAAWNVTLDWKITGTVIMIWVDLDIDHRLRLYEKPRCRV